MDEEPEVDRWRRELTGRDPVKMVNTFVTVARSGRPEGVVLLEQAGQHLPPGFWDQRIELNGKTTNVRAFRDHWLQVLKQSLPHASDAAGSAADALLAFVSYSTTDRVKATQLAVALTQAHGAPVFLDHWALGPGDRLSQHLGASIGKSGALVLLVSGASLASHWVRQEIDLALQRAAGDSRFRIVPVRLDDAPLPPHLADLVYVDWRPGQRLDTVVQSVLDRLRGVTPFSGRVRELLAGKVFARNLYQKQHVMAGRSLLPMLAAMPELQLDQHQRWLLWELLHRVMGDYPCTLKVRRSRPDGLIEVEWRDRWHESMMLLSLSPEALRRGLWSFSFDPARVQRLSEADGRFLGDTGRLSFRNDCQPRVDENPIHLADAGAMAQVLDDVMQAMEPCGQAARESFVFDYHCIVSQPVWRRMALVVGGVRVSLSLAFSSKVKHEPRPDGGPGLIVELWDDFLGALKTTELFEDQLSLTWESDVNLFSREFETLLGLA